ncbi:MAG: SH3 domain-containing protein [Deltaproteobacteria bacterium]|nr:SH3 domain-containing protein [Deltaproteobacteria bacterium]
MIRSKYRRSWVLCSIIFLAIASGATGVALAQATKGSYLTTADVEIRSGPGTKYEIVTTIPKGIKVNVVGREGNWLKVESKQGNKPGYISEKYARPLETQPVAQLKTATPSVAGAYRTLRDVELREGPGTKFKMVTLLPAGIKINVVRAEGDWLRVESKKGGKPGYVEVRTVERWKDK